MKELKVMLLAVAVMLLAAALAYADTVPYPSPSANIAVRAEVPNNSPQINVAIEEIQGEGSEVVEIGIGGTDMDFGELRHTLRDGSEAGQWYSDKFFRVLIYTTSYGHKYEVRSSCKGLSSGGNTLPAGSFMLTPAYAKEDTWNNGTPQGDMPAEAVLGNVDSAAGADRLIYRSEPAASNRIIRALYSLPLGTKEPIKLDQPPGNYTGTVTISIAAI